MWMWSQWNIPFPIIKFWRLRWHICSKMDTKKSFALMWKTAELWCFPTGRDWLTAPTDASLAELRMGLWMWQDSAAQRQMRFMTGKKTMRSRRQEAILESATYILAKTFANWSKFLMQKCWCVMARTSIRDTRCWHTKHSVKGVYIMYARTWSLDSTRISMAE